MSNSQTNQPTSPTEEIEEVTRKSPRESEAERIADKLTASRQLEDAPQDPVVEDPPEDPPVDPPEDPPKDPPKEPEAVRIAVFPTDPDGFVADVPRDEVDSAGGHEAYAKAIAAGIKERRQAERSQLSDEQKTHLKTLADEYPEDVVDLARRTYELENRHLDVDAVAEQVLEKTRERDREDSRVAANAFFSDNFGDIEADPDMRAVAARKVDELLSAGSGADYLEVVKEAGRYTMERFGIQPAQEPSATREHTLERKRQLQGHTPSSASARLPTPPEPTRQSGSAAIQEMRKARGLSV